MFSEGIEAEHWLKIGYSRIGKQQNTKISLKFFSVRQLKLSATMPELHEKYFISLFYKFMGEGDLNFGQKTEAFQEMGR